MSPFVRQVGEFYRVGVIDDAGGRLGAGEVVVRCAEERSVVVRLFDRQFIDEYETMFSIEVLAEGLTARIADVAVYVWDQEYLFTFLEELAADFRGWDGERSWSTNHLAVRGVFHSGGHVELRWELRRWSSRNDSWDAGVTTWVEAGQQLLDVAADVRKFLVR